MIGGARGCCWLNALEAESAKVQLLDEGVDNSDSIVLGDVVVETCRQQRRLMAILAFHKSTHVKPPRWIAGSMD